MNASKGLQVLSGFLLVSLGACNDHAGSVQNVAFVRTEVVQLQEGRSAVSVTGAVHARFEADLSFRISGRVIERLVDVGDHVQPGDVLARLDSSEQQADYDAAVAALASADAQLRVAATNFQRQNALVIQGFTTGTAFDQAREDLRSAEATLEVARAQLGTAKDRLGYTELRADAAGVITSRKLEVGQVIQAAQPLFRLAHDGERDAIFDVSEAIFFRDVEIDQITLRLISRPDVTATGRIREVSPALDPKSSTIRVKVAIDNVPAGMTLGSAVTGSAQSRLTSRIALPWTALAAKGLKPAVWIVDASTKTVSLQPVTIAAYESESVIIESGIAPGERIVIDGTKLLSAGQFVTYEGDRS